MKKDKSKVGAEPRVKHYFTYREGFHIGVHRDEWGLFDSNSNPYCFVNGYFFTYGRWFINRYKNNLTKDTFNNDCYCGDINNGCFGVIDRKRKIAVIKEDSRHSRFLEEAIPNDYIVIKVLNIDKFDITNNLHYLYTQYCKYLIKRYCLLFNDYYKVCNNNRAKVVRISNYRDSKAEEIRYKLKTTANKHNISKTRDLFNGKECFINISSNYTSNYIKVKYPTINQIIEDNIFSSEEKEHIKLCKYYSSVREYGIKWHDIKSRTISDIDSEINKRKEAFEVRWKEALKQSEINKQEALKNSINSIKDWRESKASIYNFVKYKQAYKAKNLRIVWLDYTIGKHSFDNIQLKLKNNTVYTSNNASVPLDNAIKLFNILWNKYMSGYDYNNRDKYFIDFTSKHITLGYYNLRHIVFREKKTDENKSLGYWEWNIQIGCHSLWLDDIKEFCRYYNLEDKVDFDCSIKK